MRRSHILRFALEDTQSKESRLLDQQWVNFATEKFRETFPHLLNRIVLEEESTGVADKEIEFVIYARMTDPDELKNAASMEHQEQWEIRIEKTEENAGKGTLRVRKTWLDGQEPVYTRTSKVVLNKETGDKLEIVQPSNQDEFNLFKFLSSKGMIKDRYNFPIVGTKLVWEIDCYPKPDGGYYDWVKIDLEVTDRNIQIPEFPISLEDVILPEDKGREPGQGEKITELYDQYFLAKNQFLEAKKKGLDKPVDASDQIATGEPTDKPQDSTEVTSDAASIGSQETQTAESTDTTGKDSRSEATKPEPTENDDGARKPEDDDQSDTGNAA